MSLAIVPGSFDPMTLGHLDVIEYAASHYKDVVVAVMINREKSYRFDQDARIEIARRTVAHLSNVRVIFDEGMLIDLFDRLGADAVCKGYRNETDYAYEVKMAEWTREHNPRFRTELIPAKAEHGTLSSTAVRLGMDEGSDLCGMVHPSVIPLIESNLDK